MSSTKDKNGSGGGGACGISRDGNSSGGGGGGGGSERDRNAGSSTSPVKNSKMTYQHGHSFIKKNSHKNLSCQYCSEIVWGIMGQAYICEGELRGRSNANYGKRGGRHSLVSRQMWRSGKLIQAPYCSFSIRPHKS